MNIIDNASRYSFRFLLLGPSIALFGIILGNIVGTFSLHKRYLTIFEIGLFIVVFILPMISFLTGAIVAIVGIRVSKYRDKIIGLFLLNIISFVLITIFLYLAYYTV